MMNTIELEALDAVTGGGIRTVLASAAAGAATVGSAGAVAGFGLGLTGTMGVGSLPLAAIGGAAGAVAGGVIYGAGAALAELTGRGP